MSLAGHCKRVKLILRAVRSYCRVLRSEMIYNFLPLIRLFVADMWRISYWKASLEPRKPVRKLLKESGWQMLELGWYVKGITEHLAQSPCLINGSDVCHDQPNRELFVPLWYARQAVGNDRGYCFLIWCTWGGPCYPKEEEAFLQGRPDCPES